MRFVLGVAEAGAYPGIIYVTSIWFPQSLSGARDGHHHARQRLRQHVRRAGLRPPARLHGLLGLSGWQWVFIVTGTPAVLLGFLTLCAVAEPARRGRISRRHRESLADAAARGRKRDQAARAIRSGRCCGTAASGSSPAVYALILTSLYGVIYWTPTVIKGFGVSGTQNGLLTALPWLVTVPMLLILPKRLREHRSVIWAMIVLATVGVDRLRARDGRAGKLDAPGWP